MYTYIEDFLKEMKFKSKHRNIEVNVHLPFTPVLNYFLISFDP